MINVQLTEGFLLGLATGTTCLATCGPVYAPYLMQANQGIKKTLLLLLEISAGRFITYLIFGAIAGWVGSGITLHNRDLFTSIAYLLLSIFLLVSTFRTYQKEKCCTASKWTSFTSRPFILGLFLGINFCPSFLIALTKAVSLSGPVAGVALFASFFFGTTIFLLPFTFFGYFGSKKILKIIARISAILVAVWFTYQSIILFIAYTKKPPPAPINPKTVINVMESNNAFFYANNLTAFNSLSKKIYTNKNAQVLCVSDFGLVSDNCIVWVGKEEIANIPIESYFLRKKGRFVVVLPESSNYNYSQAQAKKIVNYLSYYSFKYDTALGTIYKIPDSEIK